MSRVIDGDTIEVSPAVNGLKDVRLIGVDTPETVDPAEGSSRMGHRPPISPSGSSRRAGYSSSSTRKGWTSTAGSSPTFTQAGRCSTRSSSRTGTAGLPLPPQHRPRGFVRGGAARGQGCGAGYLGAKHGAAVRACEPGQRHRRGHPGMRVRLRTTAGPRGYPRSRQIRRSSRWRLRLLRLRNPRAGQTPTVAGRSLRVGLTDGVACEELP